jgi:hypothetical protein
LKEGSTTVLDDCAKYCFAATNRDLTATVEPATQGFATLKVFKTKFGNGDGLLDEVECNLVRK